jgi:hypothetical protein
VQPYISIDNRPKAPYATVTLLPPDTLIFGDTQCICMSLLDTGSETTYVPESLLKQVLHLDAVGKPEGSVGLGGGVASYYPYIITIRVNGTTLTGIKAFGWEKSTALIGRNVLNRLHICFDGENFYFE